MSRREMFGLTAWDFAIAWAQGLLALVVYGAVAFAVGYAAHAWGWI